MIECALYFVRGGSVRGHRGKLIDDRLLQCGSPHGSGLALSWPALSCLVPLNSATVWDESRNPAGVSGCPLTLPNHRAYGPYTKRQEHQEDEHLEGQSDLQIL
jgi:hypothetical protein